MVKSEIIYWHAINLVGGFGPQRFKKLESFFGSLEHAWRADLTDLVKSGIGEKQAELLLARRANISPENAFTELEKENVQLISVRSVAYPSILKQIPSAPPLLYVKGDIEILSRKAIAVVGSRKYTAYGERVAQSLCRDLASAGIAITSGLALGIDAIAHRSTLDAGGLTVAVLGSGLCWKEITPHSNQNLARDILENGGALVSEYPLHTPALRQNFPARNRIMAGLTIGTLVIEAARESGSLITPAYALEFNREVFAVPGNIFSAQAEGSNALIREGAKLVQSATDILLELDLIRHQDVGLPNVKKINYQPANEIEEKILKNLGAEPLHVDRLAKMTKLTPAELSSALSILEIQSAIKNIGGQNYIKI